MKFPPGTLHLLILKTLARRGELHGYEIARTIQQNSEDVLQVEEGSLYPALQRMLVKGWVKAHWGDNAGKSPRPLLSPDRRGTQATGDRAVTISARRGRHHPRDSNGQPRAICTADRVAARAARAAIEFFVRNLKARCTMSERFPLLQGRTRR